jgi:hypothetical protein
MHNYFYDNNFKNTKEYQRLTELERTYYVCDRDDYNCINEDSILIINKKKESELYKQLDDFRKE